MNRFRVERMSVHELDSLLLAECSEPIPGIHALTADNEIVLIRRYRSNELFRIGSQVPVENNLSSRIKYPQIHALRTKVDAAV